MLSRLPGLNSVEATDHSVDRSQFRLFDRGDGVVDRHARLPLEFVCTVLAALGVQFLLPLRDVRFERIGIGGNLCLERAKAARDDAAGAAGRLHRSN